jgi:hypothetical protein
MTLANLRVAGKRRSGLSIFIIDKQAFEYAAFGEEGKSRGMEVWFLGREWLSFRGV